MVIVVISKEELKELIVLQTKKAVETYFKAQNPFEKNEIFLTIEESAELLKVSRQTIRNYIKNGTIEAKKHKRRVYIDKQNLLSNLEEVKSLKYKRP